MNNLVVLLCIIPSLSIIGLIIVGIYQALKDECLYFVSYHWYSKQQTGHGSIEVPLHGSSIESYDDLQEITAHIEDLEKDAYGNPIKVIILYYSKLSKASTQAKHNHVIFTDTGVEINNLKKNKDEKII